MATSANYSLPSDPNVSSRPGFAELTRYTADQFGQLNDWRTSFLTGDYASQSRTHIEGMSRREWARKSQGEGKVGLLPSPGHLWLKVKVSSVKWVRMRLAIRETELKSAQLTLPDKAQFATCMAPSQTAPLLAVGSGGPGPNLFVLKAHTASLESDDESLPTMELRAQTSSRHPIHSISFSDRQIITGNDRGINMLYTVDTEAVMGAGTGGHSEAGSGLKAAATFRNKLSRAPEVPVPGKYISSRRVLHTDFEPVSGQQGAGSSNTSGLRFLSAVGHLVHVWDVNDSKAPIRDDRVSNSRLSAAVWHPYPFSQLIATGSIDKSISILDIRKRGKPVVWKTRNGHQAPINDIQWSPFVPYWLASAGDDCNTNIWDLRYLSGPAYTIQQHQQRFTSICWSNTHCDMITTGSADNHWRLWALRAGSPSEPSATQNVGGSEPRTALAPVTSSLIANYSKGISGSIESICCPPVFDNTYFTCSSKGVLTSFQLTEEAYGAVAIHRFGASTHPNQYEIEQLVYQRDYGDAISGFNGLVKGVDRQPNGATELVQLSKALLPKDPITWDGWSLPAMPNGSSSSGSSSLSSRLRMPKSDIEAGMRAFNQDLREYSYGLPPNARPRHQPTKVALVQKVLAKLSAGSEARDIEALVKAGDWKTLAGRQKQIENSLRVAPHAYPIVLLKGILKLVLPHDCLSALEMGLQAVQVYIRTSDQSSLVDLTSIVHLLLYPTVFDNESAQNPSSSQHSGSPDSDRHSTTSTATSTTSGGRQRSASRATPQDPLLADLSPVRQQIYQLLRDHPGAAIGMVHLEILVQKTVLQGGDQAKVAESIVQLMMPCPYTISAGAMRLYLNSLVQTRRYDEYLVHTSHLIPRFQGYELADLLQAQATNVVAPRLKKQFNLILQSAQRDPLNLEITMYRDTLNKLAKLLTRGRDRSPTPGRGNHHQQQQQPSSSVIPGFPGPMLVEYFSELSRGFFKVLELMLSQQEEVEDVTRDIRPLLTIWTDLLYRPQWRADQQWDKLGAATSEGGGSPADTPGSSHGGTADNSSVTSHDASSTHSKSNSGHEAIQSSVFYYPPVEGQQVQPVLDALDKIRHYFYVK